MPVVERQLPERPTGKRQRVAVECIGDEQVEAAVLGADALEERGDGHVVGVVERDGNAIATALADLLGGVLNGPGQLGPFVLPGLTVGDVDGHP